MRIILLQDILGTGKKWEVKEVKAGFGRNYLLARNLAVLATSKMTKEAELKQKQEAQKKAVQEDLFEKSLTELKDSVFIIERKANKKGHLYDAVDVREISELLKEKLKIEIPTEFIKLEKPIKETGKHKLAVQKGDREVFFEIEITSVQR